MKEKYLRSILEKKQDWNLATTVFHENHIQVMLKENDSFAGSYPIYLAEEGVFEAYIESLKGIVVPLEPYIVSSSPSINYRIHLEELKKTGVPLNLDFIYEDQLTCYFAGGKTLFYFKILIVNTMLTSEQSEANSFVSEEALKEPLKYKENKKAQEQKDLDIDILPYQKTYSNKSAFTMNFHNHRKMGINVMVEWEEDSVFPKRTDLYLKDHWNSEFMIRQPVGEKLLNLLASKREPVFYNQVRVRNSDTNEILYECPIKISLYPRYIIDLELQDVKEYQKARIQINKDFIDLILEKSPRQSNKELMERIKACLNYNQEDMELRILLILLCYEAGTTLNRQSEAVVELERVLKYAQYYEKGPYFDSLRLLTELVKKDENSKNYRIESIYHATAGFIYVRYFAGKQEQYSLLRKMYQMGERSSFLFAQSVAVLNKIVIFPDMEDVFYVRSIQWALNHQALSKEWLYRLERYSYAFESHVTIQSRQVELLYERKPSKNLLKLLCVLIIRERRADHSCFNYVVTAMEEKIRIEQLDHYYLSVAEKWNEKINLYYFRLRNGFQEYNERVREYIYIQIIQEQAEFMLLYRKVKEEILSYLVEARGEQRYNKLFMLMYNDMEEYIPSLLNRKNLAFLPIYHYQSFYMDEARIICIKSMICDEVPEVVYEQFQKLSSKDQKELVDLVVPYLNRKILVDEYCATREVLIEIMTYYENHPEDIGILYILMKHYEKLPQEKAKELIEHGLHRHTILLPEDKVQRNYLEIFYMAKESDTIILHFRYPEEEEFRQSEMRHLSYGLFGCLIKLYYNEIMDFYIRVVRQNGVEEIVSSEQMRMLDVDFFGEDEVGIRISQMIYSLEIRDFDALRQLSLEQQQFERYTKSLNRL
ncbi:MAG: hypothetical protein JW708_04035 [Vallitaleaceae bacterium]|nr:hypothetical protein [Vallitaleaceae bacterium]